jgi:hypothetical protein
MTKRHWAAVTALILGIIALVLSLVPLFGYLTTLILTPVAVIFAIIGIVKTGPTKRRGRRFAVVGLVLALIAVPIAVAWLYILTNAVDSSFEGLYGKPKITEGPARNSGSAISFGATSEYPSGVKVTTTAPITAATPPDQTELGNNVSWSTSIIYTNNGSEPIRFQPVAQARIVEGARGSECRAINGAPTGAVDVPVGVLVPGSSKQTDVVWSCHSDDPLGVITVQLNVAPEPYESQTFIRGPLDGGETRTQVQ